METVSLGNSSRSTSRTRQPARASTVATVAPAQRAPTTIGVVLPVLRCVLRSCPHGRPSLSDCSRTSLAGARGRSVEVAWTLAIMSDSPPVPPVGGIDRRVEPLGLLQPFGRARVIAASSQRRVPSRQGFGPPPNQPEPGEDVDGVRQAGVGVGFVAASRRDRRTGQLDLPRPVPASPLRRPGSPRTGRGGPPLRPAGQRPAAGPTRPGRPTRSAPAAGPGRSPGPFPRRPPLRPAVRA